MTDEQQSPRQGFQKLRLMLLGGLLFISTMTAVMSAVGAVPLVPDGEWIGMASSALSVVVAAIAWFWARPRIPLRRPIVSVDEYWRDAAMHEALTLTLFLFEGSAMIAIVGTMMAGVGPFSVAAALPVLGMLMLSPDWVNQRCSA